MARVLSHSTYQLQLPAYLSRLHPVFHISLLEPFSDPTEFHAAARPPRVPDLLHLRRPDGSTARHPGRGYPLRPGRSGTSGLLHGRQHGVRAVYSGRRGGGGERKGGVDGKCTWEDMDGYGGGKQNVGVNVTTLALSLSMQVRQGEGPSDDTRPPYVVQVSLIGGRVVSAGY